jgi:hypothetical protein
MSNKQICLSPIYYFLLRSKEIRNFKSFNSFDWKTFNIWILFNSIQVFFSSNEEEEINLGLSGIGLSLNGNQVDSIASLPRYLPSHY